MLIRCHRKVCTCAIYWQRIEKVVLAEHCGRNRGVLLIQSDGAYQLIGVTSQSGVAAASD
jgi:hypothetical protein